MSGTILNGTESGTWERDERKKVNARIWDVLTEGSPVVLTSHVRLDGDGLGSSLALWHGLRRAGIRAEVTFPPPVPGVFHYLTGVDERLTDLETELPDRFHLVVIDCGSLGRIGELSEYADRADTIVNIDHHSTHDLFGDVNLIDEQTSSSGELVFGVLNQAEVELTPAIAQCLYTAIMTDTGRFSYSNTTRSAFHICGQLVEAGANPSELSERIYYSPPAEVVRLRGCAINSLQLEADGRIATCQLTRETFARTGTQPVDTQGFADIPIAVKGVEGSALLKELSPEHNPEYVKVSLRSRASTDTVNVCEVAENFGGGGHRHAAGCELEGPIEEARERVVQVIRDQLFS